MLFFPIEFYFEIKCTVINKNAITVEINIYFQGAKVRDFLKRHTVDFDVI